MDFVRGKEIYDHLEKVIDSFDNIATRSKPSCSNTPDGDGESAMDSTALGMLFGLIAVALVFDFLNGLHDAANSIATIVSTRVLPPEGGRPLGGVLQFHCFPFFGLHVAETIGTGIISAAVVSQRVSSLL